MRGRGGWRDGRKEYRGKNESGVCVRLTRASRIIMAASKASRPSQRLRSQRGAEDRTRDEDRNREEGMEVLADERLPPLPPKRNTHTPSLRCFRAAEITNCLRRLSPLVCETRQTTLMFHRCPLLPYVATSLHQLHTQLAIKSEKLEIMHGMFSIVL